jgi:flagellar hook protein FlgE
MAFQQGLSGLSMSSKALDAVGNNIANSGTVGFKGASAQFNDVYAAALGGMSSGNAIGQGGSIATVAQTFTQGNITTTNNPLDIAINGNGFLRFQPSVTDETAQYTRNGQLHMNDEGYLVNAQDQYLCAFPSLDGVSIDQSSAEPLQLSTSQLSPRATGYSNILVPGSGGIDIGLNFNSSDKKVDTTQLGGAPAASGWTALESWDFATLNPNMYNYSTSATIYDQSGESHILSMYFVRQPDMTTGSAVGGYSWQPHFVLDGKYEITGMTNNGAGPTWPPTIDFTPSGQMNTTGNGSLWTLDLSGYSYGPVMDSQGNSVDLTAAPFNYFPNAATEPNYSLTIDFSTSTQFGSDYDVNRLNQDGYSAGRLSGLSIDDDGNISARYSNGETKLMGQISLTTFQNPNGLVPLGNNLWAETAASGPALVGTPNSGSRGAIQSGAVEDSNVDLTQELVSMITLQRAYQANAQTIKTQDSILQTLVNLR